MQVCFVPELQQNTVLSVQSFKENMTIRYGFFIHYFIGNFQQIHVELIKPDRFQLNPIGENLN